MNTPSRRAVRTNRLIHRRPSEALAWVGAIGITLGWGVALLQGQSSATSTAPAGDQTGDATVGLGGITGIHPGMTLAQILDAGVNAMKVDRLADARKILLTIVARDRTNMYALSNLGFTYERSAVQARADTADPQAPAKAARFLGQAVDVYVEAATIALKNNQASVAEQFYSRILTHRPGMPEAILGLARVFAATDRRIQAIDRYREYLQTVAGKQDAKAHLELGQVYLRGDQWRQAVDSLHRAQALRPDDADIDLALARAYLKGNRLAEGLESAKAAIDKNSKNAEYRDVRAALLIERGDSTQGDLDQAVIEARRAIEFARDAMRAAPDDTALMQQLSSYYATYEQALNRQLSAGNAPTAVRVDLAHAIQERAAVDRLFTLHRALRILSEAPAESPENVPLLETLAEVQNDLSKLDEATGTCRRLLRADPDNATAKRVLAEIKAASGK